MQFKIITPEVLRSCLSNLLTKNYSKTYDQFSKFINLKINQEEFEEFKKREITLEEINKILTRTSLDEKNVVERIENIWNEKEIEILDSINKITGLNVETNNITCFVDPYQKGGYFGEDNITVGTYKNSEDVLFVITHELFHVFYWRKLEELKVTESKMGNESIKEWELAEITDHIITTEPKMREFWKNIEIEIDPELEEAYPKFKKIWEDNSFEDYLRKSYKLLEDER